MVNTSYARAKSYVGIANNFIKKYEGHKRSMTSKQKIGKITLYSYFWKHKGSGNDPKVSWKILERGLISFNLSTGTCRLCSGDKFTLVFEPENEALNSMQEMFLALQA